MFVVSADINGTESRQPFIRRATAETEFDRLRADSDTVNVRLIRNTRRGEECLRQWESDDAPMTIERARNAATAAGRAHAVAAGRPPAPWTRDDMDAANAVFHRLCRAHRIGPYGSEPILPTRRNC